MLNGGKGSLREALHGLLRKAGLDIRLMRNVERHDRLIAEDKWRRDWAVFQTIPIRTVLDIGANTGQFARMIHGLCPQAAIHAFEPIGVCAEELKGILSSIPGARVYPWALGDTTERIMMNRSLFTPCSSLLKPNARMELEYPDGARVQSEQVEMRRLDDAVSGIDLEPDVLVKIDVQGYELHVLRGGAETLRRVRWLAIEVTFRSQYDGQPLFDEIYQAVHALGFLFRGFAGQYVSPHDQQWAYADAIFERNS